jgi:dethiobiotin synthetase
MAGKQMIKRHILMADPVGVAEQVQSALTKMNDSLELVSVTDGARCITAHAKLCRAQAPPIIVILPTKLDCVNGAQVAVTLRAIEQKLGVNAAAIIYIADPGEETSQTKDWGRAVALTRRPEDGPQQDANRLVRAIAKVLSQLNKRGRK